jgi:hypothetical protein
MGDGMPIPSATGVTRVTRHHRRHIATSCDRFADRLDISGTLVLLHIELRYRLGIAAVRLGRKW